MTPSGTPFKANASRLYILDGLRLCAALMVVSWHLVAGVSAQAWGEPGSVLFPALTKIARYGWTGVELFFLISGFVICMSSWGRSLGDFATSRIARLFPAYWFAVVFTTLVVMVFPLHKTHLSPTDTIVNMTMIQEWLHVPHLDMSYWTLAVELQFYLLFAVVVARGVTYKKVVAFCLTWTVLALALHDVGSPVIASFFASRYAPYFIAGVAFYLIHRFGSTLLLWGIVGLSWAVALVRMKAEIGSYYLAGYRPAVALMTFFFVIMAAVSLGWLNWVKWRWVATAGALTYPLYLLHQVVGLTVITALHDRVQPWALLIGVVVGLLIAAWLVHRFVERPASRLLKKFMKSSFKSMDEPEPPAPIAPEPPKAPVLIQPQLQHASSDAP